MRRLFFAVLVLAALYAGYWAVGSRQVEAAAVRAIEEARAAGWQIAYGDLSTAGFPSRFDTTVTDLAVQSPGGQSGYEADFVQVLALSYQPNRVIAIFPPTQSVLVGGQVVTVEAERLRASATVQLGPDLALDHAAAESGPATVASREGLGFGLDHLQAGVRRAADAEAAYDLYLAAEGLRLLAPGAGQGELRVAATVTLDRPLDRRLGEPPRLVSLRLDEARLAQGDVAVVASGELAADDAGFLAGTLGLRVEDWRGVLALLEAAGVPVSQDAPLLVSALDGLAQGGDVIEVPLALRDGRVSALGLDLGEAPRVR